LVDKANWKPSYSFRGNRKTNLVKLEFNATIQQVSGENWNDVKLTLSNGSPTLSSVVPGLSPFRVSLTYGSENANSYGNYDNLASQTKNIGDKLSKAYQQQRSAKSFDESKESNWAMNKAANEYQNLELSAGDTDIQVLQKKTKEEVSFPSVNYDLNGNVSLPSRNDNQILRVNTAELPAKFYVMATPIFTNYVFTESEIENNSFEVLLEGPVETYLDNRFVGRAEISNVFKGQSFVVGFGVDSQVKTKRELVSKTEKVLGGNKELTFTVRISLANFSKSNTELRVLDRIPVADEKENFRVTFDPKNFPLSTDEAYLLYEKPRGILRWDVSLVPETTGAKAKVLEYSYKLEYDKNSRISISDKEEGQMKMELEDLQKRKYSTK